MHAAKHFHKNEETLIAVHWILHNGTADGLLDVYRQAKRIKADRHLLDSTRSTRVGELEIVVQRHGTSRCGFV
jgi:hypothetical protein